MLSRLARYFILIGILFLFGYANDELIKNIKSEAKKFGLFFLPLSYKLILDFLSTYVTMIIYIVYIREWMIADRELYVIALLSAAIAPVVFVFTDSGN